MKCQKERERPVVTWNHPLGLADIRPHSSGDGAEGHVVVTVIIRVYPNVPLTNQSVLELLLSGRSPPSLNHTEPAP